MWRFQTRVNERNIRKPQEIRRHSRVDLQLQLDFWLLTGLTYFTVNTNSIATTTVLFGVPPLPHSFSFTLLLSFSVDKLCNHIENNFPLRSTGKP